MPYVSRDSSGEISAVFSRETGAASEPLSPGDPELHAFLGLDADEAEIDQNLIHTDLAFIRVLEDLIQILMQKNILSVTDLPAPAVRKLFSRWHMRSQLIDLIDEQDDDVTLPIP